MTPKEQLLTEINLANPDDPFFVYKGVILDLLEQVGSGVQTQTATITTDPDTFLVEHIFDLGHVTIAFATVTVIVLNPDGETFGSGEGELGVALSNNSTSRDGISFLGESIADGGSGGFDVYDPSGYMTQIGHSESRIMRIARYLQNGARIVYPSDGSLYAGSNQPTATVRIDVEYIA